MSPSLPVNPEADAETQELRQANAEARALLADLVKELRAVLAEKWRRNGDRPPLIRLTE